VDAGTFAQGHLTWERRQTGAGKDAGGPREERSLCV